MTGHLDRPVAAHVGDDQVIAAWVLPLLSSVAASVALDTGFITLRICGITANVRLRLIPDGAVSLRPTVTVPLSGRVSSEFTTVIPSALHRVVDLVLQSVADCGGPVLNALGAALGRQLRRLWEEHLSAGVPAALFNLDVPVTGTAGTGSTDIFLYVESAIAAPPGYAASVATVRGNPWSAAAKDALRLPADGPTCYLSLISSENSLSVLLVGAFRRGEFGMKATGTMRETLRMLAKPPFAPDFSGPVEVRTVAPPQLVLARALPAPPATHGNMRTSFALTVHRGPDALSRLRFAVTSPIWIVAGRQVCLQHRSST